MGDDGTSYGIISSKDALAIAIKRGLDLVLIAPDAKPPVAKIMDYGKFKYQQDKKAKEARKKQKTIDIKELKFTAKIAQNDMNFKVKHAIEFLQAGKHVRFKLFLKGREMSNPDVGKKVLEQVKEMVKDEAVIEKDIFREGRFLIVYAVPIAEKKKN